jgi:hypothetical protein
LTGGPTVFASTPRDLGIKNVQTDYSKQRIDKNIKVKNSSNHKIIGTISTLSDTGFIVDVKSKRGVAASAEVKTTDATVYTRNGMASTIADIVLGQKIIAVGTFDKTTNIIEAKQIKIV